MNKLLNKISPWIKKAQDKKLTAGMIGGLIVLLIGGVFVFNKISAPK